MQTFQSCSLFFPSGYIKSPQCGMLQLKPNESGFVSYTVCNDTFASKFVRMTSRVAIDGNVISPQMDVSSASFPSLSVEEEEYGYSISAWNYSLADGTTCEEALGRVINVPERDYTQISIDLILRIRTHIDEGRTDVTVGNWTTFTFVMLDDQDTDCGVTTPITTTPSDVTSMPATTSDTPETTPSPTTTTAAPDTTTTATASPTSSPAIGPLSQSIVTISVVVPVAAIVLVAVGLVIAVGVLMHRRKTAAVTSHTTSQLETRP